MSLLRVSDLQVEFISRRRRTTALSGVTFDVGEGEVVALVGESGSGKSVTAAAILGLLPDSASVTGRVVFGGSELVGLGERGLGEIRGRGIGMIFQNPLTSLDPSFRVGSQLIENLRHRRDIDKRTARAEALQWLERVGIGDGERVLRSYPHELSGGMRQRVMIAIAASSKPKLLIADEPTTALDATIQKQILDLLLELRARYGTAIVIITHDFGVVSYLSERVAVMYQGRIVEQGETGTVLSRPAHDYTRQLIESVPEMGERVHDRSPARRLGVGQSEATEVRLVATTVPPHPARSAPPVLEVDSLSKTFVVAGGVFGAKRTSIDAVVDASLTVHRGEIFGLIGESGSGKSTLARLIAQLIPATAGTVRFAASRSSAELTEVGTLDSTGLLDFRRRLQFVFQDSTSSLNPRRTLRQQLTSPILRLGIAKVTGEAEELAAQALVRVGLPADSLQRYPHEFSGGQRQRIGIARALAVQPEIVILDEPTSALDVSIQAQILNLLLELRQELDLTYLFIGHNLAVIEFLCDTVAVMQRGRILETFDAEDLYANAEHPATRQLLDAVLPVRKPAGSAR